MQSRCTRFRFGPLESSSIINRLNEIAELENLHLEPRAAEAIILLSNGDMRKVLNILESCSLAHKRISIQEVYDVTGRPSPLDINKIFQALNEDRFNKALEVIQAIKTEKSLSVEDIISEVHKKVMNTKSTDEMKMYLVSRMADI